MGAVAFALAAIISIAHTLDGNSSAPVSASSPERLQGHSSWHLHTVPKCDIPGSRIPEPSRCISPGESLIVTVLSVTMGVRHRRLDGVLRKSAELCETADLVGKGELDDRSGVCEQRQSTRKEPTNVGDRWRGEACIGNTGEIPRLGFPSLCLQDSPLGLRWGKNAMKISLGDDEARALQPTTSRPSPLASMLPRLSIEGLHLLGGKRLAGRIGTRGWT